MLKLRVEIEEIFSTEVVGSNGFEKRYCVAKTTEQYPQTIRFEFTQNNVNLLDEYKPSDIVFFTFNVKGNKVSRDGKDMYFQSCNVWKIEKA